MFTAVADTSQVAEARRLVSAFAHHAGSPRELADKLTIVVTELATNLVKHAGGGHIHARRFDDAGGMGLEVLALDRGRGMTDVGRCMEDGYSTAGSPGTGLGAISRLADDVRIWSRPGHGTAIMARLLQRAAAHRGPLIGAVLANYPGEQVCGDNWAFRQSALGPAVLLADGAGHGVEAARAAESAVQAFLRITDASCEEAIRVVHHALGPTRGAAVAAAQIDTRARTVRYVGVGNIGGVLIQPSGARHMVSHNGTAGHVAPRIREFTYDYASDPLVVLYSDGLGSRWDLAAYPGLAAQHPSLVAGVLMRDHRRGRDDASVVAVRLLN